MNVNPVSEPSAGPNYYNFDPSVLYSIGIDNNQDGRADKQISFRFRNEITAVDALDLPLSYLGNVPPPERNAGTGSRRSRRSTAPARKASACASATASRSRTTPTRARSRRGRSRSATTDRRAVERRPEDDAGLRRRSPSRASTTSATGSASSPGQRNDPFYIDLGAVFDTLNLRRFPPLLSAAEDASDANTFGFNMLAGSSVSTIAIEVPASMLTADGKGAGADDHARRSAPTPGRPAPQLTVREPASAARRTTASSCQIQRLANPLVNELVIGTGDKDAWNTQIPDFEEQFLGYYLKPRASAALDLVFGFPTGCALPMPQCSPSPPATVTLPGLDNYNRTDLVTALLKYSPADTNLSELLRLDLSADPTPLASQNRLGAVLGGDPAGWPNGRRPKDDVTDIVVRVAGGPLYIQNRAGDGVNSDDAPLRRRSRSSRALGRPEPRPRPPRRPDAVGGEERRDDALASCRRWDGGGHRRRRPPLRRGRPPRARDRRGRRRCGGRPRRGTARTDGGDTAAVVERLQSQVKAKPAERRSARDARRRVRAARPRDGRSRVVPEGRGGAPARAAPRAPRPECR